MKNLYIHILKITLIVLLTSLLSACNEHYPLLYYGEEEHGEEPIEEVEHHHTPVTVYIGPQTFYNTTRVGKGPFDKNDGEDRYQSIYKNMLLRTLAFRCTTDANGPHSYSPDFSKTLFNDEKHDDCLINSLTPGETGALSRFVDAWPENGVADRNVVFFYASQDAETPTELFYADNSNESVGYNFFAYYLDNAEVENTSVTPEKISHRISIDGTQDIMCGYAPPMNYQLLLDDYSDDNHKNISDVERNIIANIGGYSAYAANRNVDPKIRLRHMLSKLKFRFYAANSDCHNMKITSITVEGRKTGELTVAARNLEDVGLKPGDEIASFKLMEPRNDGTGCDEMKEYSIDWNEAEAGLDITDRTPITIDGSVLIMPDEKFDMIIGLSYIDNPTGIEGSSTEWKTYTPKFTVEAPKTDASKVAEDKFVFKPGATYDISIILYGLQDIKVTTSLSSWKDGGDINDDLND